MVGSFSKFYGKKTYISYFRQITFAMLNRFCMLSNPHFPLTSTTPTVSKWIEYQPK